MTLKTVRSAGLVLDPVQLAEELATLKQRPTHNGHALLCELPNHVVQVLENPLVPHGLVFGVATTPKGLACAVVQVQAASTQLLCIVPLVDRVAQNWLIGAFEGGEGVTLALSIPETEQLALIRSAQPVDDPKAPHWQATKRKILQSDYDLSPMQRGQDLYALLLSLEASAKSVIDGFALQALYVVAFVPDPSYAAPGQPMVGASANATAVH